MSCGVGRRLGSDPAWLWLWLWHGLAAAAPILPLAWELPYAAGVALKSRKKKQQQTTQQGWSGMFSEGPFEADSDSPNLFFQKQVM